MLPFVTKGRLFVIVLHLPQDFFLSFLFFFLHHLMKELVEKWTGKQEGGKLAKRGKLKRTREEKERGKKRHPLNRQTG